MGNLVFHSAFPGTKRALAHFLVLATFSLSLPVWAQGPVDKVAATVIPKTLSGYELDDLVSCSFVDKIPWRFRKDGRRTRLIVKDNLRINSETRVSPWEVHQVMDKEGFVTMIFRRSLAGGQWESIVAKDSEYNRFVGNGGGQRNVVEKQSLKNLIDRPAIIFENVRGSSLSLIPGSTGSTAVTIQLSKAEGRMLPPVFLRGSTCTRPEDESNDGATSGDLGNGTDAASAKKP